MPSPGHLANMLDPRYTQVGSGVVRGRRGYELAYVQDFGGLAGQQTIEVGAAS